MWIQSLSLRQFRNYPQLDISFSPGLNLLVGPNGAGKSNLLEAVAVLSAGESHRDAESRQFFPWEKDALFLSGRFTGEETLLVEARQERGRPRQVRVNNAFQRRLRDWLGRAPVVSFSPEDLGLVKGEPGARRRALNDVLTQASPGYGELLQRYNKVVEERNAALKSVQEDRAKPASLEPWDLSLLRDGAALTLARRDFVGAFAPLAAERHGVLAGGREQLSMTYKPSFILPLSVPSPACGRGEGEGTMAAQNCPLPNPLPQAGEGDVSEVVAANRRRLQDLRDGEVATGSSLIGPHRDDLEFFLDGRPAKAFGSQGQQRTLAVAFKLAERAFLKDRLGREPLCLLDDMLSELDGDRRGALRPFLEGGGQCLVTMTSLEDLKNLEAAPTAVFRVEGGWVSPEASSVP